MWGFGAYGDVLLLAFAAASVTVANNAFVATCALVGSGLAGVKRGIALCAAGLLAGLWLEGSKLAAAAEYVKVVHASLPFLLALLAVGAATVAKFPASLSQALVGAAIGNSVALGLPVNWTYVALVVLLWGAGPGVVTLTAGSLTRLARTLSSRATPQNYIATAKLIVGVSSFITSYSLGANTLGLLWAYSTTAGREKALLAVTAGSIIGAALSMGVTKRLCAKLFRMSIGQAISIQMATAAFTYGSTQLSIPVPMSLLTYFGVLGVAYASEMVMLSRAEVTKISAAISSTPLVTALVSWALTSLLTG